MIEATRTAIIAALAGHVFHVPTGATEAVAIPVLDHVPQGSPPGYPYVSLEDSQVDDNDTDSSDGAIVTTEVVAFSTYAGSSEASNLRDQIVARLHHSNLSVPGCHVVLVRAESGEIRRGADGMTREGVARVVIMLDDITPITS